MVKREKYLSQIRDFYDKDIIKIITGIRRSGKSVLLKQIIDELLQQGIDNDHIIYINFEDVKYANITDFIDLNNYVTSYMKDDNKYYLFFDEIQQVDKWEKTIVSLKSTRNASIFITGSNSKLLSGELATLLSGRYVSFRIAPFSFKEVVELKNLQTNEEIKQEFLEYILWGGMPQRFEFPNEESMKTFLKDIFNSIVLKDIVKRYNIKNVTIFERIMEYLVTNPSQVFSIKNMLAEFEKENIPISTKTVYESLDYAEASMLMIKASEYDIRGKRILSRKDKYYLTDLGLGQILNTNKKAQYGAYLENIVFNELLYRGYEVNIGNNNGKEIDFVATKYNQKEYYQVCYYLSDEHVVEREFGAYSDINDNYPKYVISMDELDFSQNGIIHKNIIDWLLTKQ